MHQTRIFQQPFTPKPFCSGHYIPYITCFFPQPEKPKSRAPSFLEKLATLLFTGLLLLDPSTAKLTHFITQNTSSQALAPDKNIPAAFYTKAFLHPSSPDTFYTDTFYTRHIFTRNLLDQTPFTPDTFYTRHLLHQTAFTPGTSYTNQLLHQTTFTPDNFYTNQTFTPDNFYTNQLLHQTPFTPTSFYTRHLLHQTPFTPGTFYTRHLLHQTTFTPNTFYTNRLLHQTTWQFYFSLLYLFFTPLQQNSGHYIPFPQPENLKSRVPIFSKNWQLYFSVAYLFLTLYSKTPATTSHFHSQKTSKVESLFSSKKLATLLFTGLPLLFLQLPRVHSPSTARPPDHPLQSRSSISSLLPCYFCTSSPSTARPPPVHRIIPFNLAPSSLASSHAISALPPVHSPSTGS